jgi:hypothetical protein
MEGQQIMVPVSLTASEGGRSADAHVHVVMSMALFANLRVHSTRCLLVNEGASKLRVLGEGGAVLKPAVRLPVFEHSVHLICPCVRPSFVSHTPLCVLGAVC